MKKTLMIVDDEPVLLEVLTSMLENQYDIVTASDYNEATELLKGKGIHGVISDMHLETGSGLDLISHIKDNYPLVKISLITGSASFEVQEMALSLGAFSCVNKPFNSKKLLEIASSLVKEEDLLTLQVA